MSKISEMTAVVTPATSDYFPVVQGGANKRETVAQLLGLLSSANVLSALGSQSINTVLAGPASGSAGASAFRALVAADIPSLTAAKITDFNTAADARIAAANLATDAEVAALLADYTPTADLGDTYYTESEIDTLIADYYTSSQVDALLTSYYTSAQVDSIIGGLGSTYYTETEVNNLLAAKAAATRAINTGAGLSGGGDLSADRTLALSLASLVANQTIWDGSQASRTLTFGLSGAQDPVFTFSNNSVDLSTGVLSQGGSAVLLASAIGATVQAHLGFTPENAAQKGQAGGYAPLGGDSKISTTYLPDTVLGAVDYQGTWNANTNSPNLGGLTPSKGDYYVVATSGATSLGGITSWVQGDWAIYNGSAWEKVDNTDAVASVAGKTGTVTLDHNDVTDFAEAVGDALAAIITAGANITVDYDDVAGTFEIAASASSGMTDPMTTRGDIIVRNASNVTARKAVGAVATYLRSDGDDPLWAVLSADDLAAGTIPDARFPATLPAAVGSALTALNATQLTAGTVPDARFPATLPALNGSALTALNAANLASGTVPDARFPATLPAASGANLTALNATNISSGSLALARITALTASRAVIANASGVLEAHGSVSDTELGYLDGVTSAIQTQLDAKATKSGRPFVTLQPEGVSFPATNAASPDTRLGTSTPAETVSVLDFDDTSVEYLDWKVVLPSAYSGGGLTLDIWWAATSATSGAVVWSVAVRAFPSDAEDMDGSHTYSYKDAAAATTASAAGELIKTTISLSHGAEMDNWAAGEMGIIRLRRLPTDGGDTMVGDAEVALVSVRES